MPNLHNIRSRVQQTKNFYFPKQVFEAPTSYGRTNPTGPMSKAVKTHATFYLTRVQFRRLRQDIESWRKAVQQAETYFFPYRTEMQRIFMDTVLNEHVAACMSRRKDLTLLRDFKICDDAGNENKQLKTIFRNRAQKNSGQWFQQFINYTLDALFFGYSLIEMGDVINSAYPTISTTRRENVSPDRLVVSSLPGIPGGIAFTEPPYMDGHVWVPTPGETGREACGYGLLYKVAKAEIYDRNNTAFNADYNELFGQPMRVGKSATNDPDERDAFENALKNMGSSSYMLLNDGNGETVEIIESKNMGTGHATYADFEARQQKKISKLILGHADALDSTPGKLGGGQKGGQGQESPQNEAMDAIQMRDGDFVENIINGELIPRMQADGFQIPPNMHFEFLNTRQEEELENKESETNQIISQLVLQLSQAGYQVDPAWITSETQIPLKAKPDPATATPGDNAEPDDDEAVTAAIKNLLKRRNIPITLNGNGNGKH